MPKPIGYFIVKGRAGFVGGVSKALSQLDDKELYKYDDSRIAPPQAERPGYRPEKLLNENDLKWKSEIDLEGENIPKVWKDQQNFWSYEDAVVSIEKAAIEQLQHNFEDSDLRLSQDTGLNQEEELTLWE
jgi:hypothetical protein